MQLLYFKLLILKTFHFELFLFKNIPLKNLIFEIILLRIPRMGKVLNFKICNSWPIAWQINLQTNLKFENKFLLSVSCLLVLSAWPLNIFFYFRLDGAWTIHRPGFGPQIQVCISFDHGSTFSWPDIIMK